MTLPSRHRIWNSNPGGLRTSTLPLGHEGSPQYWVLRVDGDETFLFLANRRDRGTNPELYVYRLRQTPITPALAGSSLTIVKLRQSLSCSICGHYNQKRIMIGDLDPVKGQIVQTDMTPSWSVGQSHWVHRSHLELRHIPILTKLPLESA